MLIHAEQQLYQGIDNDLLNFLSKLIGILGLQNKYYGEYVHTR